MDQKEVIRLLKEYKALISSHFNLDQMYLYGSYATHLASEDSEYPILAWKSSIKSVEVSPEGTYTLSSDEKVTAKLADGIELKFKSFEIWAP